MNPHIQPYKFSTVIIYFLLIANLVAATLWLLKSNNAVVSIAPTAILYLAEANGVAFAFVFSIGIYVMRRSDEIISERMPLFGYYTICYIILFVASIVMPIIASTVTELIPLAISLSVVSLALIPFTFDKFRYRLSPSSILGFVYKNAKEKIALGDLDGAWSYAVEMDRIAKVIHNDNVDQFANTLALMLVVMNDGEVALKDKNQKVTFRGENHPHYWIDVFRLRLTWIGQVVVDDFLAFERVCIEVVANKNFKTYRFARTEYNMSLVTIWMLCHFAFKRGYTESAEKALRLAIRESVASMALPSFALTVPEDEFLESVDGLMFSNPDLTPQLVALKTDFLALKEKKQG